MKVLKENMVLIEDKYTEFEQGTFFKQLKDRNGKSYPIPTVYQILNVSGDSVLCDVVGHDFSNKFTVSLPYLLKALDLGFFQILDEAECEQIIAKELARQSNMYRRLR